MTKATGSSRHPALAVAALALALALPAGAAEPAAPQKLDATLSAIAHGPSAGLIAKSALKRGQAGLAEPLVETILRFDGDLDAVRAEGAVVRTVIGNIATVDIPGGKLATVAALPGVVSIEAARRQPRRLDHSVPATRADTLRVGTAPDWSAGTGKGVIVGVIDSGLDFRHRDFRNADGSTRVIAIWDQDAGASGTPPAGYAYGGECTAAMINAAIAGDPVACVQKDTNNHGTHVTGIAAGNGQATGNGQPAFRMIGMAPSADILVANFIGGNSRVLDAIGWMKAKAAALGRPLVINMSFGSYYGARDGTSNYEQGLSDLAGPGVILVAAAGNEADTPIRATGTLRQGESVTVGFRIPDTSPDDEDVQLEIWYPGTNAYGVRIAGPGCEATAAVKPGETRSIDTACGTLEFSSTGVQPNNDDRQIQVTIGSGTKTKRVTGAWAITLVGDVVAGGSAPFSIIVGEDNTGPTFTDHTAALTTEILTDTSSSRRVIAVGAYNTRTTWNSMVGPQTFNMAGAESDISVYSSRGPRRDCSNPVKCPPIMKPEITAPGSMIVSSLTADESEPKAPPSDVEADGVHFVDAGTSMATPHVVGAVALMLQRDTAMTPETVKARLFSSVQANAFSTDLPVFDAATPDTPAKPNYTWGYGILDAAAAVKASSPSHGNYGGIPNYGGMWWNAPAGSESGWGINFAHQGDTLVATWFTFGRDGKPMWLVVAANRSAAGVYAGTLYTGTGPAYNVLPFNSSAVAPTAVGTATFTFADSNNGRFVYTVDGTTQAKEITRQVFDAPVPTCIWGGQPDLARATNFQDMWWNAPANSEPGWGINFAHQGDTIFATWFTFGVDGKPLWLVVGAPKTGANVYSGTMYTVTGPAFDAVPFDSAKVAGAPFGTATFTFADGNNATFAYTVNGVSQSKQVTRQVFSPPGTLCK